MQKIVLNDQVPFYGCDFAKTVINFFVLTVVTYVCYLYTSPLFVFQALWCWLIVYNTGLLFLGTPPTIDNIYFLKKDGECHFIPHLDGSHNKVSLSTELFVSYASLYIVVRNIDEFFSVTNLFTLLLFIHYWRNLIILMRAIYGFGKKSLENLLPRQYVQHRQQNKIQNRLMLGCLFVPVLYPLFCLVFWGSQYDKTHFANIFLPYFLFVQIFDMMYPKWTGTIITHIAIAISTILMFNFLGISYNLVIFLSYLAILFIYLIFFCAKDILLRESYMYSSLSDEPNCSALKQDFKTYLQTFVKNTKCTLYLVSGLYAVFVVFLLSMVFKLGFVYQFAKMLGLDFLTSHP